MVACRFVVILSLDQSIESIESLIRSPMSMLKCYKWYLNPHFLLFSLAVLRSLEDCWTSSDVALRSPSLRPTSLETT